MSAFRSGAGSRSPAAATGERTPAAARSRFSARLGATEHLLRAELRSDLSSLVNAIALESTLDLDAHEHVRRSILNYGVPDIVWRTIEENEVDLIKDELKTAIQSFEPRIISRTITIDRDRGDDGDHGLRFVVRGDMICLPVDIPVEFLADIELESRKILIERL